MCQNSGEVVVRDSTFDGNTALGAAATDTGGGAFYTNDGGFSTTSTIVRSTFTQNESLSGGAIRSNSDSFFITNSTFVGNLAINGGAINARLGVMTIYNSTLALNEASGADDSLSVETASTCLLYTSPSPRD